MVTDEQTDEQTTDRSPTGVNRFSTWVHVGEGAAECEEKETGKCEDSGHFHAWAALPNQLQHRAIREKALAAKARRVRQLRDPDSDVGVVIEDELDRIARKGDIAKPFIADELLNRDMWRDMTNARYEVTEEDEKSEEPKFKTIDQDRVRWFEMSQVDEADRSDGEKEEYAELESHLSEFDGLCREKTEQIVAPKRQALIDLDINALVDQLRDMRVDVESNEMYLHVYALHTWRQSTYTRPGGNPRFPDDNALNAAPPEVIEALKKAFEELEVEQRRDLENP